MFGWVIHGDVLFELEAGLSAHEVPRQVQRGQQGDQRNAEREVADIAVAAREKRQQDRAYQRQEHDDGEDVVVDEVHRNPLHTMKAMTAVAPTATHPA